MSRLLFTANQSLKTTRDVLSRANLRNRHNRFYIETEPLPDDVVNALREGTFGDGPVRNKDAKAVGDQFAEFGLNKDMMRKIYAINGTNVLVNDTKGIQNLQKQENS